MMTTADSNSSETASNITISQLGPFDVLCGRDKKCSSNEGNHRFRALINQNVFRYLNCESKFERSKAIGAIVKELQENPEGSVRFFKRVKGSKIDDDDAPLEQLDEKQSREKVAHALRDYASQQRNNQAKQEATSPPRVQPNRGLDQRIFPGSNPSPDSTSVQHHAHGIHPSPRVSEMMQEEARLLAEIQALQASVGTSNGVEGSEGYINYAEQIGHGHPSNHFSSVEGTMSHSQNESVNKFNRQGENHHHQQYFQQQQQMQQRQLQHQHQQQRQYQQIQKPLDEDIEESEGYDDFNDEEYDEHLKLLRPSASSLDAAVAIANEGSVDKPNNHPDGNNHDRQQPLKQPLDEVAKSFDTFDVRIEPLRGGSSMRRGSLHQMDVFERSGSNRMSLSSSRDSLGASTDLMRMSMQTLTLNESDMLNSSEVFPMGDSIHFDQSKPDLSMQLSMQQSKLDMSLQQSKLDMSCQTLDTTDSFGEKRSSS